MENERNFCQRINSGPILFFLGQGYYNLNQSGDYFLDKVIGKYQIDSTELNYNILFDEKLKGNSEFPNWADKFLNEMPNPNWFEILDEIPFSSIYTSSVNSKLLTSFKNHYRTTSGVYGDKQRVVNSRDPHNLHINYLFGCFNQTDPQFKVPGSTFEKTIRTTVASNMLQRIAEIITPLGVLILDGYDSETDWLKPETLYSIVANLANNQTFLFSGSEKLTSNEYIKELVKANKLVIVNSTFAKYYNSLKESGLIQKIIPPYDSFDGHWINIGEKKVKVPNDIYNRISRSALILEDYHFNHPLNITDDQKLHLFKDFLSNSNPIPKWSGFPLNFAFKRDFYDSLKQKCLSVLSNNKLNNAIIAHGQASSGKTVSLGQLGYELFKEVKLPVLFIERKYTRLDETDIDVFYDWAEQNGADKIIVIWDGMIERSGYSNFLKRLQARAKNILLVGSCYKLTTEGSSEYMFEAPGKLSELEKTKFENYLTSFFPDFKVLLKHYNEDNFLAMLYRYFDSSRFIIHDLLAKEVSSTSKQIAKDLLNTKTKVTFDSNSLAYHLQKAKIISEDELLKLSGEITIAGDDFSVTSKLLYLVMVPGQFGLRVPFELLVRIIGASSFNQQIFKALQKHDILKWFEDTVGNISIGPRTTFEAKLLVRSLGGIVSQVEFIKDLIGSIREYNNNLLGNESSETGQEEVQFIAELLYHISPNSGNNSFIEHLYDISDELSELREGGLVNPRLMLQEASFLRELVKGNNNTTGISDDDLLSMAEVVLRDALEITNNKSNIYRYLQVELSSILGAKLKEELNKENFSKTAAHQYFNSVYEQLLNSRVLSTNTYRALDVMVWVSRSAIEKNILTPAERVNVEITVLHLFDLYESEGVEDMHKDEFINRQKEFGETIGRTDLSEKALAELEAKGSVASYYLQARSILGNISLNGSIKNEKDFQTVKKAYDFLDNEYDRIQDDGPCLYFLFKLWWCVNTRHGLIDSEKKVLNFELKEWKRSLDFIEKLSSLGEVYYTPTIRYLHGISLFHVGLYPDCQELFRRLNTDTDFSLIGKKRIVKSYLATDLKGNARVFSGEVKYDASLQNNDDKGQIYVPELRITVPFVLRDFHLREVYSKQTFPAFNIAFNFRGLIANPIR